MNTVPVVFTRRHHIGSVLLRAALWSAWSHCALVDGDQVIEAAAGAGVRVRPLADMLRESSAHEIVLIPADDPAAVIAAARSQIGKPYDWAGVIGIGFRRNWHDASRWFCSELVAWSFAEAGSPRFRIGAHRLSPPFLYVPLWGAP